MTFGPVLPTPETSASGPRSGREPGRARVCLRAPHRIPLQHSKVPAVNLPH